MLGSEGRRGLLAATVLDLVPVAANRPLLPKRIAQEFTNFFKPVVCIEP